MPAGEDQARSGAGYEHHRRYLVPVAAIELDEHVWEWVRRYFSRDAPEPEVKTATSDLPRRRAGGRLVLLAGFATFTGLRAAEAAWATVYVLEAADEGDLLELAGAVALAWPMKLASGLMPTEKAMERDRDQHG